MAAKTWTVRALALAVLAGAAWVAQNADRKVELQPAAFEAVPMSIDGWVCVAPDREESDTESGVSIKQLRAYRSPSEEQIQATLVATATRLGALRDYSVASEAQGWTRGNREILRGPAIASLGEPMEYRVERLHHGGSTRLAATWFVSSHRQAHDLVGAELGGWMDLVLERQPPVWVELYATIDVGDDDRSARASLVSFVEAIGLPMAELTQQSPELLGTQMAETR